MRHRGLARLAMRNHSLEVPWTGELGRETQQPRAFGCEEPLPGTVGAINTTAKLTVSTSEERETGADILAIQ